MDLKELLLQHLEKSQAVPFLFVGSGFSRRYVNLEAWSALLEKFSALTGLSYGYFASSADGNLPRTAALIAEALHPLWWKDSAFEASRVEFSSPARRDSPLKIEISKYMREIRLPTSGPADLLEELALLRKATVDGVITTNWDLLLEEVFPEYTVFVGQEEALFAVTQGVAEIYKIHGSCKSPDSLVLTEADYTEYNRRNAYLAAKLLSIFVEHPVLFVGYSLSDPNILEILGSLVTCMSDAQIRRLKDHLIFVEWDSDGKGPAFEASVIVTQGKTIPVTIVRTADYRPVFAALGQTRRKFPAKLLRQLREHVYELVRDNDPKNKLHVADLTNATSIPDFEVVYGVGLLQQLGERGYKSLEVVDLVEDIVGPKRRDFAADALVKDTLPELLKATPYVPVFRYLRLTKRYENGRLVNNSGLDERVKSAAEAPFDRFLPPAGYKNKEAEVRSLANIPAVEARFGGDLAVVLIPFLREMLDCDQLIAFLRAHKELLVSGKNLQKTSYKKLVCMYDYVCDGPGVPRQVGRPAASSLKVGAKPSPSDAPSQDMGKAAKK